MEFEALYDADYELSRLFAMRQIWPDGATFCMTEPRPTHALICFESGCAMLDDSSGRLFCASAGDLVLLPAGSTYRWTFSDPQSEVCSLLFEFVLQNDSGARVVLDGEPRVLGHTHEGRLKRLFYELIEVYARPAARPCEVRAQSYRLLSECTSFLHEKRLSDDKLALILPGIRYLEEDAEQLLNVSEIAALCHISANYFTRLFYAYAGQTPCAYRLDRRLERAARMLKAGLDTDAVASALGFCDRQYLARVFRKKYGVTPAQYRKGE